MEIVEQYRDYDPPHDTTALITDLLATVPDGSLAGLSTLVLTNSKALTGDRKRARSFVRGRKVRHADAAAGLYHQQWHGQPAWIEVFVDRAQASAPKPLRRLRLTRRLFLGFTLYHELGHHLHYTQQPEHRDRETVADEWGRYLLRVHLTARYPRGMRALSILARGMRWVSRRFRGFPALR